MLSLLLLLATAAHAAAARYRHDSVAVLNDLRATPGAANARLGKDELCAASFRTAAYRRVSASLKRKVCTEYGIAAKDCTGRKYEIDHLISLELAGSNQIENLWPEMYLPHGGAKQKDIVENALHRMVCAGTISLPEAQSCIAQDWYACAKRHGIRTEIGPRRKTLKAQ
jgi:hypothetical protein